MSEDQIRNKVREMAKLTLLTDRISEIHQNNLKTYPFIFFDNVESVIIKYDLSNKLDVDLEEKIKDTDVNYIFKETDTKHLKVSYELKLDERFNGHLTKRFKALEDSVRALFWPQVKIEIFFNGHRMYESTDV